MTCHSCPHDREIARLRETCAKCRLSDVPTHGTYSLDNMTDGAIETGVLRAKVAAGVSVVTTFNPDGIDEPPANDTAGRALPSMPESAEEYVLELLRLFASLTLADVLVVHGLLRGWGIIRMADEYGESKQAIWARVRSAIRRHPWIASLYEWCKYRTRRNNAEIAADRVRARVMNDDRLGAEWVKRCKCTVAERNRAANGTRATQPCRSRPPHLAAFAGNLTEKLSRLEAAMKPSAW